MLQVVVGREIYETINRRARRCECLVVAETPQDTEPISPAVPLIQPMFQQGVHGMLCPVAVTFNAREGYLNMTFHIGSTSHQREPFQQKSQHGVQQSVERPSSTELVISV